MSIMFNIVYAFTGTLNQRFLTNQNARAILVILYKSNMKKNLT